MKDAIEYRLDPVLYMHPADRTMLTRLDKMSIVADMLGGITDFFCRQMEIQIMGGGIHVTENSMPELYRNYREVCEFFGVENPPCSISAATSPSTRSPWARTARLSSFTRVCSSASTIRNRNTCSDMNSPT